VTVDGPSGDPLFFVGFLDDYFAECDEHLNLARRGLLALEASVGRPQANRTLLDDLFRSFHSLKGISGMVGEGEAERLAHQMESYFRTLRDEGVSLTATGMDALIIATRVLGEVIEARRADRTPPNIEFVLDLLDAATTGKHQAPPSQSWNGCHPLMPCRPA
jgi:two-component system chemotaxis sensor kinase CheA